MTTDEIRAAILNPSADVAEGYRRIILRTKDGRRVEGLLKNEDTVSVQALAADGSFALLRRSELESVEPR